MAVIKKFEYRAGRWIKGKDPADDDFYEIDFAAYLTKKGTSLASIVSSTPAGVVITVPAVIQGAKVVVRLSGLDLADGALNFCRFKLLCANGATFEATMWFELEQN